MKLLLFSFLSLTLFAEESPFTTTAPNRIVLEAHAVDINAHSVSTLVNTHLDHIRFFSQIDPDPIATTHNFHSVWGTGMLHFDTGYPIHHSPKKSYSAEALLAGWDYRTLTANVFGIAIGYLNAYYHETDQADQGHINSGMLALYSTITLDHFYLEPALWGFFEYAVNKRQIITKDFRATGKAPIRTWQCQPHLELGYNITRRWGRATPFASFDYTMSWQGSYKESGAYPYNAEQSAYFFSSLRSEFGLKFHEYWKFHWGLFSLKEKFTCALNKLFFGSATIYTPEDHNKSYTLLPDTDLIPDFCLGLETTVSIGLIDPVNVRLAYQGDFARAKISTKLQLLVGKIF